MAKIGFIKEDIDVIENRLKDDENFFYDICDGGYRSNDRKVIAVTNRCPYDKQILQCTPDSSMNGHWLNYLSNKFNIE